MGDELDQREYNKDFYGWCMDTAARIRKGDSLSLNDLENVAEEVESAGRANKRELRGRVAVILSDLLKWKLEPNDRCNRWKFKIRDDRFEVEMILKDSPSLRSELDKRLDDCYQLASLDFLNNDDYTYEGVLIEAFPKVCPFSVEEVLDESFFPE